MGAIILRQSTAVVVAAGPFLDIADGYTPLTGLSSQGGRAVKGGTGGALTPSSWAHDDGGTYLVGLSASHTDTVGALRVCWEDATTHLPVWLDCQVVEEAVYDALYAGGAVAPATAAGVAAVETDTQDIQSRLPAALVSGRIDASVGAIAADAITAASIATGAVDADALAADAASEIATAVWAAVTRTLTSSGSITEDDIEDIVAGVWTNATRTLTSVGGITVASIVTTEGNIAEIVGGADYTATVNPITWTSSAWPNLTSGSVVWRAVPEIGTTASELDITIVTAGAGSQTIRLDMTDTESAALSTIYEGFWTFEIWGTLSGGEVVRLVTGRVPIAAGDPPS